MGLKRCRKPHFIIIMKQNGARAGITLRCLGCLMVVHRFKESYVNLIPTAQGGTHVNGLRTGILEALREFVIFITYCHAVSN